MEVCDNVTVAKVKSVGVPQEKVPNAITSAVGNLSSARPVRKPRKTPEKA
jgi:hypothetical protein